MTRSLFRRSALLVAALVSAVALSAAPAGASPASPPTALATVTRDSGNGCGHAEFNYFYYANGSYYDIEITGGHFSWRDARPQCGLWGLPYAPVLQWKGEQWGVPFEWRILQRGYGPTTDIRLTGSGYENVRFRVCNWNTDTGYVGTCGSS